MSTTAPPAIPMMTPMDHSNPSAEGAVGWLVVDGCVCDMVDNDLAAIQEMLDFDADGKIGVTKVERRLA